MELMTKIVVVLMLYTSHVAAQDWNSYWGQYKQLYENSSIPEPTRRFFYSYNLRLINSHNNQANNNLRTFTLGINQFTAMRLRQFNALFEPVTLPAELYNSTPPSVGSAAASYDPIADFDLKLSVQDQGVTCNSGWAYATAKAIEIAEAPTSGNFSPSPYSAQNLIDCAGAGSGCYGQTPHAALNYLVRYNQSLYLESDYANNNTWLEQGMCVPPTNAVDSMSVSLAEFAIIPDGDDQLMMQYVSNGYPVIVQFNPTSFEFMHYAGGIFQQPSQVRDGAHFMPVIGYGTDKATGLDYWLLLNSFGTSWGEKGYIRIIRKPNQPLARNAVLPSQFR